jgi:Flp pilus assembly protein TadG
MDLRGGRCILGPKDEVRQSGVVLVEASLSILVLFLVVFFTLYVTIWMWRVVSIDHALIKTARWATLGLVIPSMDRIQSVRQKLVDNIVSAGQNPNDYVLKICPITDVSCSVDDLDGTNKVFVLTVTGKPSKLMWYNPLPITSVALGRNQ